MAISRRLIALMSVSAIGLVSISAAAHSENQDASRKSGPKNSGGNTKEKVRFNDSDSGKRAKTQAPTSASGSLGTLQPESTRFQVDQKLDMPDYFTVKARTKADSNSRRSNHTTASPPVPAQ